MLKKHWSESKARLTLLEGVVDVEEGQVIPVDVGEAHLGLVGGLLGLGGSYEALRD